MFPCRNNFSSRVYIITNDYRSKAIQKLVQIVCQALAHFPRVQSETHIHNNTVHSQIIVRFSTSTGRRQYCNGACRVKTFSGQGAQMTTRYAAGKFWEGCAASLEEARGIGWKKSFSPIKFHTHWPIMPTSENVLKNLQVVHTPRIDLSQADHYSILFLSPFPPPRQPKKPFSLH